MTSGDEQDVSLMASDQYMRFVKWAARLSEQEERQFLQCVELGQRERMKPCPDMQVLSEAKEARDRLVEAYQPLVVSIARRLVGSARSMELTDLAQEGTIGLLHAVDHYDARHGASFAGFAAAYIRGCILAALRDRDGMVRVFKHIQEMVSRIRRVEARLSSRLQRAASLEEVAQEMQLPVHYVREHLESAQCAKGVLSLQDLLREGEAEESEAFVSVFEASVQHEAARRQELEQAVEHALNTALTARQREAIRLRYGFDGEAHSLRGTAQVLGVKGPSAVCGLERYAEQRLRDALHPLYGKAHGECIT